MSQQVGDCGGRSRDYMGSVPHFSHLEGHFLLRFRVGATAASRRSKYARQPSPTNQLECEPQSRCTSGILPRLFEKLQHTRNQCSLRVLRSRPNKLRCSPSVPAELYSCSVLFQPLGMQQKSTANDSHGLETRNPTSCGCNTTRTSTHTRSTTQPSWD